MATKPKRPSFKVPAVPVMPVTKTSVPKAPMGNGLPTKIPTKIPTVKSTPMSTPVSPMVSPRGKTKGF